MIGTKKDIDPASELREDEEESSLPDLDLNELPPGTLAAGKVGARSLTADGTQVHDELDCGYHAPSPHAAE